LDGIDDGCVEGSDDGEVVGVHDKDAAGSLGGEIDELVVDVSSDKRSDEKSAQASEDG
jgi:hypothetical protein